MVNQVMAPSPSQSWHKLHEFLSTFTDFLCLKGMGLFLGKRNFFFHQTASVGGMISGELLTENLGWREKSSETLSERALRAFSTNIALEAGSHFAQRFTGHRLTRLQSHLDYSTRLSHSLQRDPFSASLSIEVFRGNSNASEALDTQAQSALDRFIVRGDTSDYLRYLTDPALRPAFRTKMLEAFRDKIKAEIENESVPLVFFNLENMALEIFRSNQLNEGQFRLLWGYLMRSPYLQKIGEVFNHPHLYPTDRVALITLIERRLSSLEPAPIDPRNIVQLGDFTGKACLAYLFETIADIFESPFLSKKDRGRLLDSVLQKIPHFDEAIEAAGRIILSPTLSPKEVESLNERLEQGTTFNNFYQLNHVKHLEACYEALRRAYAAGIAGVEAHRAFYEELEREFQASDEATNLPRVVRNLEHLGLLLASPHLNSHEIQRLWQYFNQALQHPAKEIKNHSERLLLKLVKSEVLDSAQERVIAENIIAQILQSGEDTFLEHHELSLATELLKKRNLAEDLKLRLIQAIRGPYGLKLDDNRVDSFTYYSNTFWKFPWQAFSPAVREALIQVFIQAVTDFRPSLAQSGSWRFAKRNYASGLIGSLLSSAHINTEQRNRLFEAILLAIQTLPREMVHNLNGSNLRIIATCKTLSLSQVQIFVTRMRALVNDENEFTRDAALQLCNVLCDSPLLPEADRNDLQDFVQATVLNRLREVTNNYLYEVASSFSQNPRVSTERRKKLHSALLGMIRNYNNTPTYIQAQRWPEPSALLWSLHEIYSDPLLSAEETLELWGTLFRRENLQKNYAKHWNRVLETLAQHPENMMQAWLVRIMTIRSQALARGERLLARYNFNRPAVEAYLQFWQMALTTDTWKQRLAHLLPGALRDFCKPYGSNDTQLFESVRVTGAALIHQIPFQSVEVAAVFWDTISSENISLDFQRSFAQALLRNITQEKTRSRLMLMNDGKRASQRTRSERREIIEVQDAYRTLVKNVREFLRNTREIV